MSAHLIKIVTQEGDSVCFDCFEDEDIVSAGLRQEIYLMTSCREGGCATCKGLCTDGDYELGKVSSQALPTEEEENGYVLLCRCYPTSDMVVEVPYTYDRISFSPVGISVEAEIVELAKVSSNVMKLQLQSPPDELKIRFDAGQFFDLEIPGTTTTRSYSPANISNDRGELEFLIRIVDNGKFSGWLQNQAHVGQKINVKGPSGIFGLKENGFTPRYFVAGGTGLAPILSMVRRMREWEEPQTSIIYFGVNTEAEVFYAEELKRLESEMPNLGIRICVWKASDDWSGEKGSVVDVLRRDLQGGGVTPDLYLCGPPGMVDAVYAVCAEAGIAQNKIFLEKFLPSVS
ncbi:aromatic/alkene monooxygenase hydroxylase FAD-binding subunit MmoC [Methylomonas methanica]|uniref:Methane monooxygenase n=1 Tax=Methylomonas methanica (strain DSM 25384 / MC09) TaxID=857087 RepID=G0A1L2_METMM|nr:FAD-binding oxidoreductase [Methylomonas methanica]AEG00073.1 Methane monooxygenase [Methylomonas methanica MC09]